MRDDLPRCLAVAGRRWQGMFSGGRQTGGFAAALLAVLFAFTLRALIPAGYMPEAGDNGFRLVICGPAAPAGADHAPDGDDGPDSPTPVCVFAVAGPVAGPAEPLPLPRPVVLAVVRGTLSARPEPPAAGRSEGPPPPARAPPLSI